MSNPYEPPSAVSAPATLHPPSRRFTREKRQMLWGIAGIFVASSLISGLVFEEERATRPLDFATAVAIAICTYRWCDLDARQRGHRLWRHFGVMLVICPGPIIILPIYFFVTRGTRGFLSIAKTTGFAIAVGAAGVVMAVVGASVREAIVS